MDQFSQFSDSDPFLTPLPPEPPVPVPAPAPAPVPAPDLVTPLSPLPEATYPSKEALFEAIQTWSKPRGYAFTIRRSKLILGREKVYYACDWRPLIQPPNPGSRKT